MSDSGNVSAESALDAAVSLSTGEAESQIEQAEAQAQLESQQIDKEKEAPKDDRFASKFAALSRKEKALRAKEQEIQKKLADFESMSKQREEEYKPFASLKDRVKTEPLKVLEEHGLTYEQLTKMILEGDGGPTPEMKVDNTISQLQQKIEQLESRLTKEKEDQEKSVKDMQEEASKRAEDNFKVEIKNLVNSDEKYELIKAHDAIQDVFEVVEQYYYKTGKLLSKEEAADQVEAALEEEVNKMLSLEKIKKKLGAAGSTKSNTDVQEQLTLSNDLATESVNTSGEFLSDEESKKRAAQLIKWIAD